MQTANCKLTSTFSSQFRYLENELQSNNEPEMRSVVDEWLSQLQTANCKLTSTFSLQFRYWENELQSNNELEMRSVIDEWMSRIANCEL